MTPYWPLSIAMASFSRLLGVGLLASSSVVTADTGCDNASTQLALTECSAQAYQSADDELNDAYQSLVRKLEASPATLEQLRKAQRAWISFRDAECALESSGVEGGSAQPMVRNGCLATLTKRRTERLREHAHCEEGDLSCPR
ncbi:MULTISPECIES: lysozyme inhibitor LprI family protein [Halomonadaceae]|uniref:Lysozyme inhibitor LprI family protein n=1 Tax=Vreelandella janggokensis TaxID=370767 RepID=A0ABT4IX66_9GAMM|nr:MULTISPECIES: lysozyme inhibitor LprI family protein [Halomonas]MCW4151419.1 lysozyme inhibitor LprI family protein [Halomonas sp. 18H]MCZ0928258.1 lysozyme inhibitor LprI family protein [Halomonas janggokensis]MDR5887075.1 lysozyme inhibitor LprI family protein [Halomonas janggokensis]